MSVLRTSIVTALSLIVLMAMFLPFLVHANDGGAFVPLAPVNSDSGRLNDLYSSNDLGTYVSRLFFFAITIGAILAVVRLMWAGYQYMGSADMWSTKQKAKETFGDAIFGILLLLGIYLILYQINPDILKIDILSRFKSSPANSATGAPASTPPAPEGWATGGTF